MGPILGTCAILILLLAGPALADRVNGGTEAVNGFRAKVGGAPLKHSGVLQQAAERHLRDLARRRVLSHRGADGSSLGERVRRAGYRYCIVAENVAHGQGDVGEVILGWASSEGHRENLLNRQVEEFGFAQADRYWVLVLARPGC